MQVLILLSEFRDAQQVAAFCETHNMRYWLAENRVQVHALLAEQPFDLVFLDLNEPDGLWQRLARNIREKHPQAHLVGVTTPPAADRKSQYAHYGIRLLLAKPLTTERIEQTLLQVPSYQAQSLGLSQFAAPPTQVHFPVRFKIILPYLLLSLIVVVIGLLMMNQLVVATMEERFQRQLVDAGIMTADRIVQEERTLLANWRTLAFTAGVAEEVAKHDAEALRNLVLPSVINDGADAVDFITTEQNSSLLSLRHDDQPTIYQALTGVSFAEAAFVQDAFQQSNQSNYKRHAGLFRNQGRQYLYVAGPLIDQQQKTVGLLLVGRDVTEFANNTKQSVLANITFYNQQGDAVDSTLAAVAMPPALAPTDLAAIVQKQEHFSLVRKIAVGSSDYHEILGIWRTSRGDILGVYGAALPRTLFIRIANDYRFQLGLWIMLVILIVVVVGLYLANRITMPLARLIRASTAVAGGNLDVRVDTAGADEIGMLVASFNYMVQQLRETVIYRDLLGRTVSVPVRDQLRQSFHAGELQLTGQAVMATVLMSDIRNFTPISERADSTTVLRWLNEYFSELVPVISGNHGVISTFAGDSLVAFFGVLPKPGTLAEGAYSACLAATEMLAAIELLNERRRQRGEPPLLTGIALHSGIVTAGGLGSSERVQYTVVGDTVNATSRLGEFTKTFKENIIVASQETVDALGGQSNSFYLEALGNYELRGKLAPMMIYRLEADTPLYGLAPVTERWRRRA